MTHRLVARIFLVTALTSTVVGGAPVAEATHTATQAQSTTVDVGFSRLSSRYPALKQWKLHDATVFGNLYVFPVFGAGTSPRVKKVEYWIDSSRPTSPYTKANFTSTVAPYDMTGAAANREARPWNTVTLSDQAFHSVTMRVTYADSSKTTLVASPYVSNGYRTLNGRTLAQVLEDGTTGALTVPRGRYLAAGEVRGTPRAAALRVGTDGGEVVLDGGTLTLHEEQQHLVMTGRFHLRGTVNLAGATDVQLDGWEFQNPGLTKPPKAVKFTRGSTRPCEGCRVTNSSFSDVWSDFLYVSGAANWAFSGNRGVRQYDLSDAAHIDGVQVAGDSTNATVMNNDLEAGVFVSNNTGPVVGVAISGGLSHKSTRPSFQTGYKAPPPDTPVNEMSGITVDSAFRYGRTLPDGPIIHKDTTAAVTFAGQFADPLPGHEKDPYRIILGTGAASGYGWFTSQGTAATATVGSDTGFKSPGMLRPLLVAVPATTTVTAPQGFAEVSRATDPSGLQLILYSKTIAPGDPNVLSVSFGAEVPYAVATATYRYQRPSNPWVGTAANAGSNLTGPGGTAVATAPNLTPTAPNSLNLRFFAAMGAGSWTPPASYGRVRNNLGALEGGIGLLIFDPVFSDYATPGPTGTETAVYSSTVRTAGMTAAMAPATAPPA